MRNANPDRAAATLLWAAWTVALLLAIAWKSGALWSDSVDVAHHYTLVERLSETGAWFDRMTLHDGTEDPSLGEMAFYPRATHVLAAVIGRIVGSSLIGMQIVAVLAYVGVWAGFAVALGTLPRRSAIVATSVVAALLIANRAWSNLPIHGDEIFGSYFFAQLAAQCVEIWVVVLVILTMRHGAHSLLAIGLAIAAMAVVACFHLLPAVELLAFVGCWLAFDLLTAGHGRAGWWRGLAVAAATMIGGTVLIVLHPAFAGMREISMNNGSLDLGVFDSQGAMAALAIATGLASALVLAAWRTRIADADRRDHVAVKLLALHGVAVALAMMAQLVALRFGLGSEYAIKKYAYGLVSALMIDAGLAAALVPWRIGLIRFPLIAGLVPLLLPMAALISGLPAGAATNLAPLVALETQVKLLRETRLPWREGHYDVALGLSGTSHQFSYLLSIGVLRAPRDRPDAPVPQILRILQDNQVSDLSLIGTIVTSIGSAPYDLPACRKFVTASRLALVDATCAAESLQQREICAGPISFAAGSFLHPSRISGFSVAERAGRWTDGPTAVYRCILPGPDTPAPTLVSLDMTAFLAASHGLSRQRVAIGIEGGVTIERVFRAGEDRQTLEIPLGPNPGPELEIRFSLPDAISPEALGLSRDTRRLGVYVHGLRFD